jgi:hypothetical protein
MVPVSLYFNFKDILRSPRIALSGKKIWIFITGNLIGYLFYWIISYLSLVLSGYNLSDAFSNFGLYPHIFNIGASSNSIFIYSLGLIVWISLLFISSTAVSRVILEELNGNHLFSITDAWIFSLKHWKTSIFTPLTIMFIIITLLILGIFFTMLSSIPYAGSIIYFSLFPIIFFGSVFITYTAIVLVNSLIYSPAIIASYEEDIMGTIFQSYSISWAQPWRVITYNIIILILIIIGVEVFSWFCISSCSLIYFISKNSFISGENLNSIINLSFELVLPKNIIDNIFYIRSIINIDNNYLSIILNIFEKQKLTFGQTSSLDLISSMLLSSFLFIILLSIFSYALSIFCVGQTISFLIFKKLTDDDDILKRSRDNSIEDDKNEFFNKNFKLHQLKNKS